MTFNLKSEEFMIRDERRLGMADICMIYIMKPTPRGIGMNKF